MSEPTETIKFHAKEILDYEKGCRPTCVAMTSAEDLNSGDHIHWSRIGNYRDGIVHQIDNRQGSKPTIHMIRYGQVLWSWMTIQDEKWEIDFSRDTVYRYEYGEYCHPPYVVIARAKACVGQGNYNALRNNNDDFCRWCKSGKHTYLCMNETFLVVCVGDETRNDNGTHIKYIGNFEMVNQGDHLSWKRILTPKVGPSTDVDSWRHGVVTEIDGDQQVEVVGFRDASQNVDTIIFSEEDFDLFKVRKIIYERCNMPEEVLDRALSQKEISAAPENSELFTRWCKTGVPSDADAQEVSLKVTEPTAKDTEPNLDEELAKGGMRSAGVTAARTVERGVTAAVARHGPRVLVRKAVERVAAVAAVGVEAVILGVEVGLTYKKFNKREITKDDLNEQNIRNTVQGLSAAGGTVAGGAGGAAIGTIVFPVVGTIVGGIIGGIVGGIAGQTGGYIGGKSIANIARRPYEYLFVEDDVVIE